MVNAQRCFVDFIDFYCHVILSEICIELCLMEMIHLFVMIE